LEAQRLGLEAYASDLNPVAVLINKAMIEIPPKFAGRVPVNQEWQRLSAGEKLLRQWQGAQGLAEDVRYYGHWIRAEAEKRIGHLYPKVEITKEMAESRPDLKPLVGQKLTVIAWLWARTVKSPNPAFSHVEVPLASSFLLSEKDGKEAYVEPVVERDRYHFTVRIGPLPPQAKSGTTAGKRAAFICLMSATPIDYNYIRAEGRAGRMGQKLMAVVAEGARGRIYLPPTLAIEAVAAAAKPEWKPDTDTHGKCRVNIGLYGLTKWGDLFTPRQLVSLTTFSDLVGEVRERIYRDALSSGLPDDSAGLRNGGAAATAYAEAVSVYLAFSVDKEAEAMSTICTWSSAPKNELVVSTFRRQALAMTWDFAEANPFAQSSGSLEKTIEAQARVIDMAFSTGASGAADQQDAQSVLFTNRFVSTDPPYYDNIGYADLSDFFYVWLRYSLRQVFPDLFATVEVPKAEELVATPYRHKSKEEAESFFLDGMTRAMNRLTAQAHPGAPITIYYAFKQSDTENDSGTSSAGWETFLDAVLRSGLQLTGTWPMRTERESRSIGIRTNSLASSIILVCRPRAANAPIISRRSFLRELNNVLPEALDEMTRGTGEDRSPVAPVDFSQAIIGPGMAVFSKYGAVLEADGTPMSVKTALQLINRFFAEDDFDHDTQFCLHWFQQNGWKDGRFGDADTLARAKGTSVDGVKHAGILYATGGVVRLRRWAEYPPDWEPARDSRLPVWEVLHQLIRVFSLEGESGAGVVLAAVQAKAEAARQLAYRLYTLCERAYNEIITSWSAIESAATRVPGPEQAALFDA
jgi:putative DNA methylase